MESQTFIPCLAWVLKGYAAHIPKEIELSQKEIDEMKSDPMIAQGLNQQEANRMNNEDEEEDDLPVFGDNFQDLMNAQDKYPLAIEDLSDDEKEDYYIKDTDALIVAGKIEKQHSCLEVYIYEQDQSNLFVHHQIMLSSFPLDIAWLRVNLGSLNSPNPTKGNYAIVSSFLSEIQIWNLDLTEAIEPDIILGGEIQSKKKKPKNFTNNAKKYKPGSHTDSILSISLNKSNLSILASGSADQSVKIWDLSKEANIYTTSNEKGKIKKVEWSTLDVSVMFSCCEDQTISILDSRFPKDHIEHRFSKEESIESACWNVNSQPQIAYVTDKGNLHLFDVRMPDKILVSQKAHKGIATDVKIGQKNLCYTCSEDQTVKVWNLEDLTQPLASKNPKCGTLFCLDIFEEAEGPVLSAGNSNGELFVWDVTENAHVNQKWKLN